MSSDCVIIMAVMPPTFRYHEIDIIRLSEKNSRVWIEKIINRGLPPSLCSFEVFKVEWRSTRVLYPPNQLLLRSGKLHRYNIQEGRMYIPIYMYIYIPTHVHTHLNLLIFSEIPYAVAPLYVTGNAFTGYAKGVLGWVAAKRGLIWKYLFDFCGAAVAAAGNA